MWNEKMFVLLQPLLRNKSKREKVEILKEADAEIAQLVEHDLAKVGVASSSLVFRSKKRE